jgi:PIN domain nuclease of toxin-antitoxin system
MSDASRAAIADAATNRCLHVSPFSAWEVGMLVKKRKIALTMPPARWFSYVADHPAVTLVSLSHEILIESSFLPAEPPGDPADRIIIATARQSGLVIVTRDRLIVDYAAQGHVRVLPC